MSPTLNDDDKIFIQQVTGTFLYYVRAVDSTMLVALRAIAAQQAQPTEQTMKKTLLFFRSGCNISRRNINSQRKQHDSQHS